MKSPSRWVQPREVHSAHHHGSRLPAIAPPPVHTTWEETPPIPQEVVSFPACNAYHGLFSWHYCSLRALPWAHVKGHLTQ